MRLLIVNYRYFVSSGPERYMFSLKPLLEQRGIDVVPFSVAYRMNEPSEWSSYFADPIAGGDEVLFEQHTWTPRALARTFERAWYSRHVEERLGSLLAASQPDAALVLQYLRKLSPSVLVALKNAGIPIVARLSDYGIVCPGLQLMRNGTPCELCLGGSVWPSVRYRCVRGSWAASAVNAFATQYHRNAGYFDLIDGFITPSAILREKLIEAGFPASKVHHIPTFVMPYEPAQAPARQRRLVYVGRFDPMKGIDVIVKAFAQLVSRPEGQDLSLCLFGDSDSRYGREIVSLVSSLGLEELVEFRGFTSRDEISEVLSSSLMSIVASITYENMPNSLLESWACGTPVLASDIGSLRTLVGGTGAGELFAAGDADDLASHISALLADPTRLEAMGVASRRLAAESYSPAKHVDSLLRLFDDVRAVERT